MGVALVLTDLLARPASDKHKRKHVIRQNRNFCIQKQTTSLYHQNSVYREVPVCSLSDFDNISKKRVQVSGKDIILLKNRATGEFCALDSFCYHAGGPLHLGDIEDFGGKTCLVCPWHKYKVCVSTGEMIYQAIDPHNLKKPPQWKSSGQKQRTHKVVVRDGHIYVKFTDCTGQLQSDQYNSEDYREKHGLSE